MKKLIIISLFLVLIVFLYMGPLKNIVKKGKKSGIIDTFKIIDRVGEAVETYIIDWGQVPKVRTYNELLKIFKEKYEIELPKNDKWGNKLVFRTKDKDSYEIISPGKDKKIGTADDIIYKDGEFEINKKNKIFFSALKDYLKEE